LRRFDAIEQGVAVKARTRVRAVGSGAQSGGRNGESLTLGTWKIRQVLVDNKSVAEIGNRCLPLGGTAAPSGGGGHEER
jgi:hypothetical protein